MRTLTHLVTILVLLALGAAALFAEPREEQENPTLGLSKPFAAGEGTAEALVKALAEKPRWQVRIDATFLRVDAAHADEILGAHRPDVLGSARAIPRKLARQLVSRARGAGAVRPEPLPSLILHADQAGRLSATGQHAYLQDYDLDIGGMGSHTMSWIVGRMRDGTRVDLTPRRDGKRLLLDLDAAWAVALRPIPVFEASHPKVTIQLPELLLFQVQRQVELPVEGGYVLAGGGRAWDDESLRLVVLEVRRTAR